MGDELLVRALAGDRRALARTISHLESGGADVKALIAAIYPKAGSSRCIGITGPPGAGKSTLTSRLVAHYRQQGHQVGVVAVDPSSPFTGGAILGDRIRMVEHFADPDVFIRSMATRGHLGGLAAAAADVVDLLDAAGFGVVLLETIGVGQDDVEVARLVDVCVLVLTPGQGDDIQIMKSGIMEIGDVYAINKVDLPGADRVEAALHAALAMEHLEQLRPIVRTTAADGGGIEALASAIDGTAARLGPERVAERRQERARERIDTVIATRIRAAIAAALADGNGGDNGATDDDPSGWARLAARVADRELDPYTAADAVLRRVSFAELHGPGERPGAQTDRAREDKEEDRC